MDKLFFHIISGILGLYLAARFVPGVEFYGPVKILILAGVIVGLANFFIKPILKTITLPIRILTLGLFSLIINMLMVWIVDIVLPPQDLEIKGIIPLFWATLIIWALNMFFGLYSHKKRRVSAEE